MSTAAARRGLPALLIAYGVVRLALFACSMLLLLLFGVSGSLLVVGAFLASSTLSYPVLRLHRRAIDRSWADRKAASR